MADAAVEAVELGVLERSYGDADMFLTSESPTADHRRGVAPVSVSPSESASRLRELRGLGAPGHRTDAHAANAAVLVRWPHSPTR